jgi:hypothetical protein
MANWEELGLKEPRTANGNPITHLKEVECRTETDGTEKRLHLGYSGEGFHAAIENTTKGYATHEPFEWGKAYPEAGPALKAVWDTSPDSEKGEGKTMAEIPDDVKARADMAVSRAGAEKMPVQDMGETKGAEAYDTKALEAQRERQRQDAIQDKTAEPNPKEPDKG